MDEDEKIEVVLSKSIEDNRKIDRRNISRKL